MPNLKKNKKTKKPSKEKSNDDTDYYANMDLPPTEDYEGRGKITSNLRPETDKITKQNTARITSTWSAFQAPTEEPFSESPTEEFKELLNFKPTQSSHFQFSSEKGWMSSVRPINSRFSLNVKSLEEDLSSIVFYERQNLPASLFSEQELAEMRKNVNSSAKASRTTIFQYQTKSNDHKVTRCETSVPKLAQSATKPLNAKSVSPNPRTELGTLSTRVEKVFITSPKPCAPPEREAENLVTRVISAESSITANKKTPDISSYEPVKTPSLQHIVTPIEIQKTAELEDWLDSVLED